MADGGPPDGGWRMADLPMADGGPPNCGWRTAPLRMADGGLWIDQVTSAKRFSVTESPLSMPEWYNSSFRVHHFLKS